MVTKKALEQYAETIRAGLPVRIRNLIAMVTCDLYYGPSSVENEEGTVYPGFSSAIEEIQKALEDIGDIWIDIQSDEVLTSEPQPESYQESNPDYDPNDEDSEEFITCYSEGDYECYNRKQVIASMVDKALVSYL